MRHLSILNCFFLFLLVPSFAFSQGIGIGQWRTHLPYQRVIGVELAGEKVYAATPYDLFIYNTEDNRLSLLNKVNGLSDIGVSSIRYSNDHKTLLVAYANTNIDLIRADEIVNISDIKNKELIGNKTINNIMFIDKYAYLSCGFGIVVIDIVREEVYDTYLIGPQGSYINVFDLEVYDNTLYAATENGVYYAPLNSPNLADFNQWTKDTRLRHPNLRYTQIEAFADKLFLNYSRNVYNADTLFVFNGNNWDYFDKTNTSLHRQVRAYANRLLVVNHFNVYIYDENLDMIQSIYAPEGTGVEPLAAAFDASGNYWVGDRKRGLLKTFNNGFSAEAFLPNGPGTTSVYELKARGNYVWVAPGGRRNDWGKMYIIDGVFSFDGSQWRTYNSSNTPGFDTISDFVSVAIDPQNPKKAYIGTWQEGVIEFTDFEKTEIYSTHNSSLGPWLADPSLVNISGLGFDSYNNLWACNTGATNILSMRKPNGEWKAFYLGSTASGIDVANMIIDKSNNKWIIRRSEGKIMVFNDNNTFDNPADDQLKILTSSANAGNIPGNAVFSMAVDLDGAVWVGTDKGPVVFYNPERIFQTGVNYDAQQILVPRNDGTGQADFLLGSEKILAIAVDGSNKKWFGTENGVFLMSKDGLEQIFYFNTDNSPLLSNTVNSIAITDDGEVFFGTPNGIISFKGNATTPPVVNTDVYAYPNPVRQEYSGPVAIKGMVRDAIVKITDLSGNLVFQTRSEGGQAIWDGRSINGNHVSPGIYLVFITDNFGEEKLVTKVMMMRKQ
jgi:hypothetical protein